MGTMMSQLIGVMAHPETTETIIFFGLIVLYVWVVTRILDYKNKNKSSNNDRVSSKKMYDVSLDGKYVYPDTFEPQKTLFSVRYSIQRQAIATRKEKDIKEREQWGNDDRNANCPGYSDYYEDPSNRNEDEQERYEFEQNLLRLLPSENFVFILANGQPVPRNEESQWKLQYTMKEGFIRLSTPKNIHNFGNTTINNPQ
jgi:hypothetical protein